MCNWFAFLAESGVSERNIVAVLISFVFGSNLFYYRVGELSMSHVYSFAFVAGFLLFAKRRIKKLSTSNLLLASLFLGIIILIRPVNGIIVLFLPFLAESQVEFYSWVKAILKRLKLFFMRRYNHFAHH